MQVTMSLFQAALLFCAINSISGRGLREEYSWSRITYVWPYGRSAHSDFTFPGNTNSPPTRNNLASSYATSANNTSYIYQNNIPMGANVWKDKLFITIPRRRLGVPSSLNYVSLNPNGTTKHNVPLIPYPNWDINRLDGLSSNVKIISVYRVGVDECDRLWFVDTGLIEIPGNPQQVQPPALLVMDLKTDRLLRRYEFNSTLLRANSGLASVTIDITNHQCGDAFAYIPDLGGYGLLVYSLRENRAWRVTHNYFFLEPLAGEFTIGGHSFQWNDGIFSIALSDTKSDGYKDAYFHSMAGLNQYRVSTRVLKNESLATRSYHLDDFEVVGNRGEKNQASSSDLYKPRGILFLALVHQNALGCWNVDSPLSDLSIVQKNDEKMIYPSDVKVSGDNIIVLTNTMPVFLYGNLDYDQTNFRVWIESVETAVRGTKCDTNNRRPTTKY